jgi:hypothetical protein
MGPGAVEVEGDAMKSQETAKSQEQQSAPEGYYLYRARKDGPILYLSNREREQTKYQGGKSQWYRHIGKWMCRGQQAFSGWLRRYATVVIMIATVVNVGVAYYQWDAAQQNIGISKQALLLPNRPWLIEDFVSIPLLVSGQETRMEVRLKNVGHSLAFKVVPCAAWYWDTLPIGPFLPPQCPSPERLRIFAQARPVLPDNTVTMPFLIPGFDVENAKKRHLAIYLFGAVTYEDFSHALYRTTFCLYVTGEQPGVFSPCPEGNIAE